MKLGSLFDGIGGFPLSAMKFGIEPVWASEIELWPTLVTQKWFQTMKHLGDITKIDGRTIEPVDIITFGSPCQDLSVAGKREGLAGARSGLFMEAVRIIREMRTATGGQYPRFAVWENVPGAFSSNKGEDFRAVLEEIGETKIPMPGSGKWATAGMVRTERVDVAWRTLDAQHWGVPQRRRRIFLVADFGGKCAGKILFIEEGMSWNPATSGEAGEDTARAVGNGIKGAIGLKGYRMTAFGEYADDDCSSALKARDYKDATDLIVNAQLYDMTHADEVIRPVKEGIAPTLNSRMGTGGNQVPMMVQNRYVRRLTPLECLRLQGYPDWWLDVDGMSDTAKYKAIGNSVAIPCVDFVLGGIARVLMNY